MGTLAKKTIVVFVAYLSISECLGGTVCEREAVMMLSKIDDSIGICDNFYDFACGNYKPVIPDHKVKIDELGKIQDTLQERLNEVMGASVEAGDIEPFRILKTFYQNCMNKEMIEKVGLKTIEETLNLMGGWPVTLHDGSWNEENWSWQKMVTDLELVGFPTNYLYEFSINPDVKNSSIRVLGIDQPTLGVSREYLIEGLTDKIVQAYHSFQVDTAVIYGANRTTAEREMMDALNFEIKLAKLSLAREDRRNGTRLYNPIALKDLQKKFPSLDWVEYFNTLIDIQPAITEDEVIIMSNETLFVELNELLSTTPKRTIANYMMWRASFSVSALLHDVIRNRSLEFNRVQSGMRKYEPRWKECVGVTAKYLPIATGAIYVRKYFDEKSKKAATEMIHAIRSEFEETLRTVPWMDEETRASAIHKVEKMENHIAYPNELMDDAKLNKFHETMDVPEGDYLRSVLNLNYFRLKKESKKLRKPINKTDWEAKSDVAIANAYYGWFDNSILIPAGILQGQFFSADRPRYMNFASIGLVIGHEISHGFDDQGRQYDSEGNLIDWWQEDTKKAYLEKAQCIIDQYGNYIEPSVGMYLNGVNTQGENIADNGGVITAYRAYQKWSKENEAELPLPGLNFTVNQLFWLSLAQSWCSVFRPEELETRIKTGVHSIARFRIIGPLSNTKEFSDDFNCAPGSPMNPAKKCKVW